MVERIEQGKFERACPVIGERDYKDVALDAEAIVAFPTSTVPESCRQLEYDRIAMRGDGIHRRYRRSP